MKALISIALTLLVLMFVAVPCSAQTYKPVTITDDQGTVDIDTVTLSSGKDSSGKDKDERVRWTSSAQHTVYVVFYTHANHTPFKDAVFPIAPGGSAESGPIQKKYTSGNPIHYKYAVVGTLGSNDPTVIIDR